MVFAPTGRTLAEAKAWDAAILVADLSAQLLADYRNMPAYTLRARNPKAYGPLVEGAGPAT
jgi:predicted amidohydrolase